MSEMSEMLKVRDLNVYYGGIHAIRGVDIDVRQGDIVTIIGSNGAGKSSLLNAISGIVKYHGYQSDMKRFYAMAGCVVLPSYHEGMSNVLLEAAASGRPLITSDIPGCREAVEPGVSGYLCPARDADALYAAMRRFLELPPAQRTAMGCRGRERMERQFGKATVVAETIKHLEI